MMRQRVNLRIAPWGLLTRVLTIVFALALIYGGVMVALLAAKISPHDVNSISGYRTIYDDAVSLRPSDFTTEVSLIAGFGGLLMFLVFAFLTLQSLPRPYFTRSEIDLPEDGRGLTTMRPRAMERVAEFAAQADPNVVSAAGRLSDEELNVDVGVTVAAEAVQTLSDVRRRVAEQLQEHGLPGLPVNVTLTGYERPTRRDTP